MIRAFVERRWWASAFITLIFSPFIGMLYLGRGLWAVAYCVLEIVAQAGVAGVYGLPADLPLFFAVVGIRVVGIAHSVWLVRSGRIDPRRIYARWYSIAFFVVIFPVAAIAFRTFLYQPFDIPAGSMEPTLLLGDHLFVSKMAYVGVAPQRGDIILFRYHGGSTIYVKRVAGLPGDKLQMVGGRLILNGKLVKRIAASDFVETSNGYRSLVKRWREVLPDGKSYFTLDRDADGAFDNTQVYVVPAGHYFVMGDDRDNSADSRANVGFVPSRDIVGKPVVKFYNSVEKRWMWEAIESSAH